MADHAACPAAALAREARAITAALDRNEATQAGLCPAARIPLEHERDALEDCRTVIEDAASQRRAASAEGALFQAALVVDAAERINAYGQDRYSGETEAELRRVRRLAYSVIAFVEREAGLRCEDVFGDWYTSRDLDPHATVDKALAGRG